MTSRYPFDDLSTSGQKRAFVVLLVLTLIVMAGMNTVGRPLNTEAAPMGIISFELAGELSLARRMVESWGSMGRVYAGLNLGLDYLFMVAYSSSIALGCILVARSLSRRVGFLFPVGVLLAWAQFGAALLDALENYALIQVLLGSQQASWPVVARWCAIPKFLIVATGLAYVGVGAALAMVTKNRSQ
jgi:hypothetical protein